MNVMVLEEAFQLAEASLLLCPQRHDHHSERADKSRHQRCEHDAKANGTRVHGERLGHPAPIVPVGWSPPLATGTVPPHVYRR